MSIGRRIFAWWIRLILAFGVSIATVTIADALGDKIGGWSFYIAVASVVALGLCGCVKIMLLRDNEIFTEKNGSKEKANE